MPASRALLLPALPAALAALLALGACSDAVTPAPPAAVDDGQYGSLQNAEEFNNAAQALPVEALRIPPEPVVLASSKFLGNLPAVAMQGTPKSLGSPGTCEAQSFGYGLGSYTAARNPDGSVKWDAGVPGNEMSAAYQFALAVNQGHATCPKGGNALVYLSRLTGFGSPTAADVPYEPSCEYFASIDLSRTYADAKRLRIGSFATFQATQSNALWLIKTYLQNDQAVAFSGPVYKNYANAPLITDGVFYDVPGNLIPNSGHGQLLVGFDDNVGTAGNKGALLVQNSFGTDWPPAGSGSLAPPGKLYWSYETFLKSQTLLAVAYPYDPSSPSGAPLTASTGAAPVATIERAWQWTPVADGATFMVFMHHLADAVRITSVTVKEPAPGAETATGQYGQFLSKGYTYFKRTDGKAFLPGVYSVRVEAVMLDGVNVAYTGTVEVPTSLPVKPAGASMKAAAGKLFDSTGKSVAVALSP